MTMNTKIIAFKGEPLVHGAKFGEFGYKVRRVDIMPPSEEFGVCVSDRVKGYMPKVRYMPEPMLARRRTWIHLLREDKTTPLFCEDPVRPIFSPEKVRPIMKSGDEAGADVVRLFRSWYCPINQDELNDVLELEAWASDKDDAGEVIPFPQDKELDGRARGSYALYIPPAKRDKVAEYLISNPGPVDLVLALASLHGELKIVSSNFNLFITEPLRQSAGTLDPIRYDAIFG